MTERKPEDLSAEHFSEAQIRQAYAEGEFAALPGYGQPLPGIDEPLDDDWWIKQKLRREKLSILPPSLEIRRDVAHTLEHIKTLGHEKVVRREIEALNVRIRDANLRSVWGPPSTQMPLDVEAVVERWKRERT